MEPGGLLCHTKPLAVSDISLTRPSPPAHRTGPAMPAVFNTAGPDGTTFTITGWSRSLRAECR
ncbi:hypothetical protein GCM10010230_49690 [Streptomyces narbonensis]|nr:hypothetical protein GCM10010230_49690 [Streptomyces narbonensis]